MKKSTANQLAPSFSLLLVISLLLVMGLLGCSDQPEVASTQNQQIATESIQQDELIAEPEPAPEPDLIAESTMDMPESVPEEIDENVQETPDSVDQTIDTLSSEITEPETPISEFTTETQSAAVELEHEIHTEKQENLNEVVKSTPELIRSVQQALANAGYNPGTVDGINVPRTMSALKSFQKQNDLAMGQLTKETLLKLEIDY
jgi:hypothetical protein